MLLRGLSTSGAVLGGLSGGVGRGLLGGVKGKGSAGYGKIFSDAAKATGTSRNLKRESDYGWWERRKDNLSDLTKVNYKSGSASKLSDNVKNYQKAVADSKQKEEAIKQNQQANMQALLSKKRYDSSGNEVNLRPGEFNKINGEIDKSTLEQIVKFGDFTVDWDKLNDKEYKDKVYEAYKNDAVITRGLTEGEYLDEKEFDSAFELVADFRKQDKETKEFEKLLKSAQESKDARDKKGK